MGISTININNEDVTKKVEKKEHYYKNFQERFLGKTCTTEDADVAIFTIDCGQYTFAIDLYGVHKEIKFVKIHFADQATVYKIEYSNNDNIFKVYSKPFGLMEFNKLNKNSYELGVCEKSLNMIIHKNKYDIIFNLETNNIYELQNCDIKIYTRIR